MTAAGIAAQTENEKPPVNDETPVVVSRDLDATKIPVSPSEDVRESANATGSRLPVPSEIELPRTTTSPYNIKISEAQQKMMLYLDLLTKTETRAENLRAKLFEFIEQENSVLARIQQVEFALRPDQMQNSAALIGSLRPEEIRAGRSVMLNSEKRNLEDLLLQVRAGRRNLEAAITGADRLVERVRAKLETFVDAALEEGDDS